MLQIQSDQTIAPSAQELDALRVQFRQQHYVRLGALVQPELLSAIKELIDPDGFEERLTPNIGCVECCTDQRIENGFQALLNQEPVREAVGAILGERIDLWGGNTVRRVPGRNHFSNWHNDLVPPLTTASGARFQRVAPMSLNISDGDFEGGNLEIRSMPGEELIADVVNAVPGDAILFEINDRLQHRVADVTGGCPRMVHVGWFHRRIA